MILTDEEARQLVAELFDADKLAAIRALFVARPGWREIWPHADYEIEAVEAVVQHARRVHTDELRRGLPSSLEELVEQFIVDEKKKDLLLAAIDRGPVVSPAPTTAPAGIPRTAWLKLDRDLQVGQLTAMVGPQGPPVLLLPGPKVEAHWNLCRRVQEAEVWPRVRALAVKWAAAPATRGEIVQSIARALRPDLQRWDDLDFVALMRAEVAKGPLVLCLDVPDPLDECADALLEFYLHELPAVRAAVGPVQVVQPVWVGADHEAGQAFIDAMLAGDVPLRARERARLAALAPPGAEVAAWLRAEREACPNDQLAELMPITRADVQRWANLHLRDAAARPGFVAEVVAGAPGSQKIFIRVQRYIEDQS